VAPQGYRQRTAAAGEASAEGEAQATQMMKAGPNTISRICQLVAVAGVCTAIFTPYTWWRITALIGAAAAYSIHLYFVHRASNKNRA